MTENSSPSSGTTDFRDCLNRFRAWFGLTEPPELEDQTYPLVGEGNAFARIFSWYGQARRVWDAMGQEERRLAAAVKVATLCATWPARLLRHEPDATRRTAWIKEAFENRPPPDAVEEMIAKVLKGEPPRPFQEAVASSGTTATFVKAGCGTGKTAAAYLWAARQHPGRRVYFCYPTTGTATEGFRDYLMSLGQDVRPDLFHGRSQIDLDLLGASKDRTREDDESVTSIESLEAWSTPIVSCTVDTVLGLVQNNRRGLFAWPGWRGRPLCLTRSTPTTTGCSAPASLPDGVPGVPVLMMTASLPEPRLKALRRYCERRKTELKEIAGPKEIEGYKRYSERGPSRRTTLTP